jgi:proline iminopeptidase
VITLHGGPGSKSKAKYVKPYDLEKFQIITFDQRGCGESLPAGETENNTLQDLVSDIERLRSELKIKKWFALQKKFPPYKLLLKKIKN